MYGCRMSTKRQSLCGIHRGGYPMVLGAMLVLLSNCPLVRAWWPVPHMVIAKIAQMQLTPAAQANVDLLLQDFSAFYPGQSTMPTAAIWADMIKTHGNRLFSDWHFVDIPLVLDGVQAPPPDKENVVWALEQCVSLLQFKHSDLWGRALALRLLLHIVGDIHQPLHCASRFSPLQPHGDHGGNTILVQQSLVAGANNLHAFWDAGAGLLEKVTSLGDPTNVDLGFSADQSEVEAMAQVLMAEWPVEDFPEIKVARRNLTEWAIEAYELAVKMVYAGPFAKDIGPAERVDIPSTYGAHARKFVKSQMALAGYRLAELLNRVYTSMPSEEEAKTICSLADEADGSHKGKGDRAAPVLATVIGLLVAICLSLVVMLLRERERFHKLSGYTSLGEPEQEMETNHSMAPVGYGKSMDEELRKREERRPQDAMNGDRVHTIVDADDFLSDDEDPGNKQMSPA